MGDAINLADEHEVDGEMNTTDGLSFNDKNVMVSICLFG